MTISLLLTGALFLVDFASSFVLAIRNMPDGYEDELGFHYGVEPSRVRIQPLNLS